jgi:hypothetical protein
MVSRRPHGTKRVAELAPGDGIDGAEHPAGGECGGIPGVRSYVRIARGELAIAGVDVMLRGGQVLACMAQQKFLQSGRAALEWNEKFCKTSVPQAVDHSLEPFGALRMAASGKVIQAARISKHSSLWLHVSPFYTRLYAANGP